ncbi:MAG: hypothetical protein HPY64_15480 [Anaerolineae bacterium]|nr:hypothetical protein [Anaerolineae bacterium]
MMKRLFSALLLAVVILSCLPASLQAQSDLRLASLRVGLWPEYDQPALLVIYWGQLAPETSYPATVRLRMPARVAVPHVVAAQNGPDQAIDEVDYTSVVEGDWRVITFQAGGPQFQFEYYDTLTRQGTRRTGEFTWPGDYAVDSLSVELQEPPGAQEVTTQPALQIMQTSPEDGLVYRGGGFGALQAGQSLTIQVGYTRTREELTTALLTANRTTAATPSTAAAPSGTDVILLVMVAVVFFLLGAAAMRVAINLQALNRQRRR